MNKTAASTMTAHTARVIDTEIDLLQTAFDAISKKDPVVMEQTGNLMFSELILYANVLARRAARKDAQAGATANPQQDLLSSLQAAQREFARDCAIARDS